MDQKVLAAINLFSVLRNLEDVCELDNNAKFMIKDLKKSVRFSVPGLEPYTLKFENGRCKGLLGKSESPDIHLRFTSPAHFNDMVNGKKNPIPTRGFTKIGFLKKQFKSLTNILESYLKPDLHYIKSDKTLRDKSTLLTAYTAFYALSQIAKYDEIGYKIANKIEDGAIGIRIGKKPEVSIVVQDGKLSTHKGEHGHIKAYMDFLDMEVAGGILRGNLDTYACIGNGSLAISGRVPMIDSFNKLLNRVSTYLA